MSEANVARTVLNLHVPATNDLYVTGNISTGGTMNLNDTNITGGLSVTGDVAVTGLLATTGNIASGGSIQASDDLYVGGNIYPTATTMFVDGNIEITGTTTAIGDLTTNAISVGGNITPSTSELTIDGNVHITGHTTYPTACFKVYKEGLIQVLSANDSILRSTAVGNTFNSYDNNPYGTGGWDFTTGSYEIPKAGYWKFEMTFRANDSTSNVGFKPLLFSNSTENFMVASEDNTVWLPEDNSNRRMATYATSIYCGYHTLVYAIPYATGDWKYGELSGRFVGLTAD